MSRWDRSFVLKIILFNIAVCVGVILICSSLFFEQYKYYNSELNERLLNERTLLQHERQISCLTDVAKTNSRIVRGEFCTFDVYVDGSVVTRCGAVYEGRKVFNVSIDGYSYEQIAVPGMHHYGSNYWNNGVLEMQNEPDLVPFFQYETVRVAFTAFELQSCPLGDLPDWRELQ